MCHLFLFWGGKIFDVKAKHLNIFQTRYYLSRCSPQTVKCAFRPWLASVEDHLQLLPTSRSHSALFFFCFLFFSSSTLLSLPSLAGPSAGSCNIYGCLEQTLAAGNWRAHLLPKKTHPKPVLKFIEHIRNTCSPAAAPLLKTSLFARANAFWVARQISPQGLWSKPVNLPTSRATLHRDTLRPLCITNAERSRRVTT